MGKRVTIALSKRLHELIKELSWNLAFITMKLLIAHILMVI